LRKKAMRSYRRILHIWISS